MIPQTQSRRDVNLHELTLIDVRGDESRNRGNIIIRSQFLVNTDTDANLRTYSNIPQHLLFIDLARNGINTGLSLIGE